jgi:hypothetical protein
VDPLKRGEGNPGVAKPLQPRLSDRGPIEAKVHSMTAIVEGVYKQGKIELQAIPAGLQEGPVRVILMAQEPSKPPPKYLTFGMYPGDTSTLEDFRDAEWHGEEEFDNLHGQ